MGAVVVTAAAYPSVFLIASGILMSKGLILVRASVRGTALAGC
ncbi:MAG TPA: hypothetical protein VLH39_03705 [Magnetospirillaceae bacterium]|nr:hypothetical protein [Magnetospirillaceae bacterium]